MKLFVAALIALMTSATAHASLFSCEQVVTFAVESHTRSLGLNDEVVAVNPVESNFNNLKLYWVMTQKPSDGSPGLLYSATWLVVARDFGTSAGCVKTTVFHDLTAW